jgi:histone H3/H4
MSNFQDKTDTNYDLPKANIQRIIKTVTPEG